MNKISWWERELPTAEEMREGLHNLEEANWSVDFVLTHCTSSSTTALIRGSSKSMLFHERKNMFYHSAEKLLLTLVVVIHYFCEICQSIIVNLSLYLTNQNSRINIPIVIKVVKLYEFTTYEACVGGCKSRLAE